MSLVEAEGEVEGRGWLVAPYGEVNWVRNARVAGLISLSRGGHSDTFAVRELGVQESAPVLKRYLAQESFVRPYFDVRPEDPLEVFAAIAERHPVFLLQEAPA